MCPNSILDMSYFEISMFEVSVFRDNLFLRLRQVQSEHDRCTKHNNWSARFARALTWQDIGKPVLGHMGISVVESDLRQFTILISCKGSGI